MNTTIGNNANFLSGPNDLRPELLQLAHAYDAKAYCDHFSVQGINSGNVNDALNAAVAPLADRAAHNRVLVGFLIMLRTRSDTELGKAIHDWHTQTGTNLVYWNTNAVAHNLKQALTIVLAEAREMEKHIVPVVETEAVPARKALFGGLFGGPKPAKKL